MRSRLFTGVLALASILAASPTPAQAPTDIDSLAVAFREALAASDVPGLRRFFADTVRFEGDTRFVGGRERLGQVVVTRDQLAQAYTRLFADAGRAEWSELIGALRSTLQRAARDGQPPLASAGDYVYTLTQPGRSGPDDSLVFIFRRIEDRWRIVAHWADY